MKHSYSFLLCDRCQNYIAENWYVRHRKSGCQVGVTAPDIDATVVVLHKALTVTPSNYLPRIWDCENIELVLTGWGRYTIDELVGLVNLRQWQLGRSDFASAYGVVAQAVLRHLITPCQEMQYRRKIACLKQQSPSTIYPVWGTNPATGKPVSHEIGQQVSGVRPEDNVPYIAYQVVYPTCKEV